MVRLHNEEFVMDEAHYNKNVENEVGGLVSNICNLKTMKFHTI